MYGERPLSKSGRLSQLSPNPPFFAFDRSPPRFRVRPKWRPLYSTFSPYFPLPSPVGYCSKLWSMIAHALILLELRLVRSPIALLIPTRGAVIRAVARDLGFFLRRVSSPVRLTGVRFFPFFSFLRTPPRGGFFDFIPFHKIKDPPWEVSCNFFLFTSFLQDSNIALLRTERRPPS